MIRKHPFFFAFLVAWIAAFPLLGYLLFTGGKPVDEPHIAAAAEHAVADREVGSLGAEREALLAEATRRYVSEHKDAPAAMAEGKELAPVEYLNEQLAAKHARFRVREVKGVDAEIYEVS